MSRGEKLLDRMRTNPGGWTKDEIETVYNAHGFEKIEGGKHTKYKHPDLPGEFATVTRSSGQIATGYARRAIELIDKLRRQKEVAENESNET